VALLSKDMERLADAHRLARRASRIIRENLASPSAPWSCWSSVACSSTCRCRWP
jgi:cation transport ATPase